MTEKNEWPSRVALILFGTALGVVTICVVVVLPFLRGRFFVPIPPQDCGAVSFVVSGKVVDGDGNPTARAEILLRNDQEVGYSEHFTEMLTTDTEGRFASASHTMFACDELHLVITTKGFERQTLTYKPPSSYGWPDQLPDNLIIVLEAENE